jgi:hypothetical protein
MPKRVVGILIISVLAGICGAASAAQQGHGSAKSVAPATTQPPPSPQQTSASAAKFAPVSRDVCAKHPNLKQCS